MIAEADSGRSTLIEQLRERLAELWSYLTSNQTRLITTKSDAGSVQVAMPDFPHRAIQVLPMS
jgi:hypothetical protein